MYFTRTPGIIRRLFSPELVWEIPNREKQVFLTFDDGPHPQVTTEVLEILASKDVPATFFCVGENVQKYPDTFRKIKDQGHQTGNHTFNHLNGWKTETKAYLENITKCAEFIDSKLFRPPYGRIKNAQINVLKEEYKIIMWSVLSGDFDKNVSRETCVKNVMKNTKSGSIIVFHDSIKAKDNVLYALPRIIDGLKENAYTFGLIK